MKKQESIKGRIYTLRKCASNQLISMEVIPQFSPQPYFVRKQIEQIKFQRGNSLTPRKKFVETKRYENNKERLMTSRDANQKNQRQEPKIRAMNSPMKIQKIFSSKDSSLMQTNFTNFPQPSRISEMNFSEEKLSSSKSVRFSNRFEDNKSVTSRRQGSRTPSILKNKNRKYGNGLTSVPSQRSFSINHSFHSNHKQAKKRIKQLSNTNAIIKKKYEAILKGLQMREQKNKPPLPGKKNIKNETVKDAKFKDEIFPPVYSSIFPQDPKAPKYSQPKVKQIQWKRISDIFPNQKLVLFDKPQPVPKYFDSTKQQSKVLKIRITKQKKSYASQFMVTALNSIKNNEDLLCKIFQDQEVNENGIYLIKIFQENTWKYIIVDDFIPVIKSNMIDIDNPYIPAFIDVKPQSVQEESKPKRKIKISQKQKHLPIWPFLLQKAYANYYSSYEALTHGQILDLVGEFCGISYEKISLVEKTDPEQYLQVIDKLLLGLKNGNVVVLAQLKDKLPMIPLHYKAEFCYSMITQEQLFYYDPHDDYRPSRIKFYDLGLICTHLYVFTPVKYVHDITCTISKPKHKISSNLITKINKQHLIPRDIPTIRKFTLKSACECSLFVRQKDKRFLYRLGINYIWLRVILIAKQYDGSYSWVDGQYTNKKGISFNHMLDPGEYYVFIYPEWGKEKYNHEIHVTLYSNQHVDSFERFKFDSKERMLQQACTDLAQKNGKLKQINQYICTYNFVDRKSAMIIQNIINEKLHGEINIARSIQGLKSQVEIVPVNDQFYEDLKQKSNQEGAEYLALKKTSIDVKIQKSQSYTVILKMKGGIDYNFFRVFAFGS